MIIRCLTLLFAVLVIIINVNIHQAKDIAVVEHPSNAIIANDSDDQSWQTTTEKTLIRITRLDAIPAQPTGNIRRRRDFVDPDEILGMAKRVAISVFVLVSVCIVCCVVTTIYICFKCCCGGGNNNRKRNQGFVTVPQPIIIHTGSPNYQPQFQQQQAPSPPYPPPAQQSWGLENHPMLPQPSAPPQPFDDFNMERPPAYEKVCGNN